MMSKEKYQEIEKKNNKEKQENLKHAQSIYSKKSKQSHFYYKLTGLNDKIRRYKVKFGEWEDNYIPPPRDRTPTKEPEKSNTS